MAAGIDLARQVAEAERLVSEAIARAGAAREAVDRLRAHGRDRVAERTAVGGGGGRVVDAGDHRQADRQVASPSAQATA